MAEKSVRSALSKVPFKNRDDDDDDDDETLLRCLKKPPSLG